MTSAEQLDAFTDEDLTRVREMQTRLRDDLNPFPLPFYAREFVEKMVTKYTVEAIVDMNKQLRAESREAPVQAPGERERRIKR